MPRGDRYWVVATALADGAFLDLDDGFQGADTEAIIDVLERSDSIELHMFDGATSTVVMDGALTGKGIDRAMNLIVVKAGERYRVKNVSGGNIHVRGAGTVTK
jgi:hypothetical protein